MDRRHLEYFLAVADAGSFTRAAGVLNIAQPSLSYTIAALERELGSQLFERVGRGVKLTAAGEALLGPARRTVRSFTIASGAVRSVAEGGYGRLALITNTLWAIEPLVPIIAEFRQLHPAVQFTVADPATRPEVLDEVRLGNVDFGLIDGTPPAGALGSQLLVEHELMGVLPPRTPAPEPEAAIEALVGLGLICTPRGTALRTLLDERLELASQPLDVAVETAHLAAVVPLVLAGAGGALLPDGLAAEAAAKGARVVRLVPQTVASVHVIWRSDRLGVLSEQFLAVARDWSARALKP